MSDEDAVPTLDAETRRRIADPSRDLDLRSFDVFEAAGWNEGVAVRLVLTLMDEMLGECEEDR